MCVIWNVLFWRNLFLEDDTSRARSLSDRYRVSFWKHLSYRRFVSTTLLAFSIVATSHRSSNSKESSSSNPESSKLSQRNFEVRITDRDEILRTSSSNMTIWFILLEYSSIRNLLLSWVVNALILTFSKLIVSCARMMTKLWILSLMKVTNEEFSWRISSRRRFSTNKCWKSRSWASRAHWVSFSTSESSVI